MKSYIFIFSIFISSAQASTLVNPNDLVVDSTGHGTVAVFKKGLTGDSSGGTILGQKPFALKSSAATWTAKINNDIQNAISMNRMVYVAGDGSIDSYLNPTITSAQKTKAASFSAGAGACAIRAQMSGDVILYEVYNGADHVGSFRGGFESGKEAVKFRDRIIAQGVCTKSNLKQDCAIKVTKIITSDQYLYQVYVGSDLVQPFRDSLDKAASGATELRDFLVKEKICSSSKSFHESGGLDTDHAAVQGEQDNEGSSMAK